MLNKGKGFTIVEMSIILVIFGLLFVISMHMVAPIVERIKQEKSKKIIDSSVISVIGFAQVNGRLPSTAEFPSVVTEAVDIWGKDLVYLSDSGLAAGNICDRDSTALTVQVCGGSSCTAPLDTIPNVAFLILSSGSNLNIQTNTTVNPVKAYQKGLAGIDDFTPVINRLQEYDDIVKWMTLSELRTAAGCEEAPLNILDVPLPSGLLSSPYDANFYATGGVPFADINGDTDSAEDYEWCVTSSAPGGLSYVCNPGDGALASSLTCGEASGTWQQCSSLELSGTPVTSGAFRIFVYVKDSSGNIGSRIFAVTIGSISGLNICPEYRVWNGKPAVKTDYRITALGVSGVCDAIFLNDEVTGSGSIGTLTPNEEMEMHTTSNGSCGGLESALTYNQAIVADTNGDCCIWFDQADRTCP
ncbi:MAG: hypothetical protein HY807_01230 [Nitrospirae bacterium]|nr:hypothetical protein [Nitrospirota bacterium]